MDSKTDSIEVWSTMVNHPLCYYDPHYDAHMCAWAGIIIPRTVAMMLVSTKWLSLYPNDSQKSAVEREFQRLLAAGALKWSEGTPTYHNIMSILNYKLYTNEETGFKHAKERVSAKQAMAWFLPGCEKTLERTAF